MKKIILSLVVAAMATISGSAQQIAVVKGSVTNIYLTLKEAIEGAQNNSVIYLPGGGFTIADSVKITKSLTIIGISHKAKSDNAEGCTTISGNLFFNEGSSNSAIMGCYVSGTINIGENDAEVKNISIRYCNVGSINVLNNKCNGLIINRNYVRDHSNLGNTNATITNNVLSTVRNVDGGIVSYNILLGEHCISWEGCLCIRAVVNSSIMGNILATYRPYNNWSTCSGQIEGNMRKKVLDYGDFGDNCINITEEEWTNIFTQNSGINPASNYHFSDDYKKYESQVGIYGGTGFSDGALPPVPYISEKKIAEQTDAAGKLSIQIKVNAGYNDGTLQGGTGGGTEPDVPVNSGGEDGM